MTIEREAALHRPEVRVLLACRNGAAFVERQIASVLAQRGVTVTIDVRDDGSTDSTADRVAAMATEEPRIRLDPDRTPSGSASANFFKLIRTADVGSADFIAFCDQDDEWHPDKLERSVACLRGSGSVGYSAAVQALWPDGRTRVLGQQAAATTGDYLFEGAGQGCTFVLEAGFFRELQRSLETVVDRLLDVHYHDWLIYAMARASGRRWHFDPTPTMTYYQHGKNDTGARLSTSGVLKRLALIRLGWYRRQAMAVARIVVALHPTDLVATRWLRLADPPRGRLRRLAFIVRHGRRRPLDRAIQVAAVLGGYL